MIRKCQQENIVYMYDGVLTGSEQISGPALRNGEQEIWGLEVRASPPSSDRC